MSELQGHHINKLVAYLKTKRKCKGDTINSYLNILRALYRIMQDDNLIDYCPVNKKHMQQRNSRIDFLLPEQLNQLCAFARKISENADITRRPERDLRQYYWGALVELLTKTGCRLMEAIYLRQPY